MFYCFCFVFRHSPMVGSRFKSARSPFLLLLPPACFPPHKTAPHRHPKLDRRPRDPRALAGAQKRDRCRANRPS